jgi:uncharacterized membrane-anchored protein
VNIARRTALVSVILTAALAGMIAKKQYTLVTGTPILLETQPVDPRSLFRGDYVRLNYSVNTLDLAKLEGDDAFLPGDKIHVVLERGEKYWHPVSVHRERPQTMAGAVTLAGRVSHINRLRRDPESAGLAPSATVHVRYGIENYFVPEGEGRDLERPSPGRTVDLRIAVDRFGNAGIKAVLVDGEERYREALF